MQNRCFARRLIVRSGATPVSGGGDRTKKYAFTDRLTFRIKSYLCGYGTSWPNRCGKSPGPLCSMRLRLMPQLSPWLAAPQAARLREIAASPSAALFAAEAGGCVRDYSPSWYDMPVGPQGMNRGMSWSMPKSTRGTGAGAGPRGRHCTGTCGGCRGAGEVLLTSNPARRPCPGIS